VPTAVLALAVGLSSIGYAAGDVFPAIGRPGAVLGHTAVVTVASMVGYWLAAPYGITAVALVLLGQQLVLGALRLRLTNRLVGTSWPAMADAMTPAVASAVGVAVCALPVVLLLPHGVIGMLLTLAAGLVGAGLGVLVAGRSILWELRTLLRGAR